MKKETTYMDLMRSYWERVSRGKLRLSANASVLYFYLLNRWNDQHRDGVIVTRNETLQDTLQVNRNTLNALKKQLTDANLVVFSQKNGTSICTVEICQPAQQPLSEIVQVSDQPAQQPLSEIVQVVPYNAHATEKENIYNNSFTLSIPQTPLKDERPICRHQQNGQELPSNPTEEKVKSVRRACEERNDSETPRLLILNEQRREKDFANEVWKNPNMEIAIKNASKLTTAEWEKGDHKYLIAAFLAYILALPAKEGRHNDLDHFYTHLIRWISDKYKSKIKAIIQDGKQSDTTRNTDAATSTNGSPQALRGKQQGRNRATETQGRTPEIGAANNPFRNETASEMGASTPTNADRNRDYSKGFR